MPKNIDIELEKVRKDVSYIRKALEGNGHTGLIREVENNTTFRNQQEGKMKMLHYLTGSGWFFTLLLLFFSYLK